MVKLKAQPLADMYITSRFGLRDYGGMWWHNGIDLRASIGTPVYAVASGVIRASKDGGSYGLYIAIDHDGWGTLYSHLSKLLVKAGDKVESGDLIGYTGNTSTMVVAPHLHFEIRIAEYNHFWERSKHDSTVFMRCVDPEMFINQVIDRNYIYKEVAKEILKEDAGLEDKTINYLDSYIWRDDLIVKLAKAIR